MLNYDEIVTQAHEHRTWRLADAEQRRLTSSVVGPGTDTAPDFSISFSISQGDTKDNTAETIIFAASKQSVTSACTTRLGHIRQYPGPCPSIG